MKFDRRGMTKIRKLKKISCQICTYVHFERYRLGDNEGEKESSWGQGENERMRERRERV